MRTLSVACLPVVYVQRDLYLLFRFPYPFSFTALTILTSINIPLRYSS